MRKIRVIIDRLILADLGITPAQGERLGRLVAGKVESLLRREGCPVSRDRAHREWVSAPPLTLTAHSPESRVADSLARSIVQALRDHMRQSPGT